MPAVGRRPRRGRVSPLQNLARVTLGSVLVFAGIGHLSFAREEFRAQVPRTLGLDPDAVVVGSGWVEIALGAAILARGGRRPGMGRFTAGFFAAVFPGNLAQFVGRRDGFGLDTDNKRAARLLGQPVLMAWALWSMGAIGKRRA
ncbi:hypothetical protein BGP79_02980 [Tersicoccus sp. Bi-70]|nr:hypothetical protein BGP79_02980 [Tersicoccus sp. Bi-70]